MLDLMGIYSFFDKNPTLKNSLSSKISEFEKNGFLILC